MAVINVPTSDASNPNQVMADLVALVITQMVKSMSTGGQPPAADGSVKAVIVFDTDTGKKWFNRGLTTAPTWQPF